MKVLLGHLNWELGTGGSRSAPKWLAEYLGLTLVFVCNGAQRWRFNIHFQGFSPSIGGAFLLVGRLGTGLSFYVVQTVS